MILSNSQVKQAIRKNDLDTIMTIDVNNMWFQRHAFDFAVRSGSLIICKYLASCWKWMDYNHAIIVAGRYYYQKLAIWLISESIAKKSHKLNLNRAYRYAIISGDIILLDYISSIATITIPPSYLFLLAIKHLNTVSAQYISKRYDSMVINNTAHIDNMFRDLCVKSEINLCKLMYKHTYGLNISLHFGYLIKLSINTELLLWMVELLTLPSLTDAINSTLLNRRLINFQPVINHIIRCNDIGIDHELNLFYPKLFNEYVEKYHYENPKPKSARKNF